MHIARRRSTVKSNILHHHRSSHDPSLAPLVGRHVNTVPVPICHLVQSRQLRCPVLEKYWHSIISYHVFRLFLQRHPLLPLIFTSNFIPKQPLVYLPSRCTPCPMSRLLVISSPSPNSLGRVFAYRHHPNAKKHRINKGPFPVVPVDHDLVAVQVPVDRAIRRHTPMVPRPAGRVLDSGLR